MPPAAKSMDGKEKARFGARGVSAKMHVQVTSARVYVGEVMVGLSGSALVDFFYTHALSPLALCQVNDRVF